MKVGSGSSQFPPGPTLPWVVGLQLLYDEGVNGGDRYGDEDDKETGGVETCSKFRVKDVYCTVPENRSGREGQRVEVKG